MINSKLFRLGRMVVFLLFGAAPLLAAEAIKFSTDPFPAKSVVTMVEAPNATQTFRAQYPAVRRMVSEGLITLSGKTNETQAWLTLVSTQDVIGLKVVASPGGQSGTRPAVVRAVVESLLAAGIQPNHIVLWDKHLSDLRAAGFDALARDLKIRMAGASDDGFDENSFYDNAILGNLVWGDFEFGKTGAGVGRKSFVSKLVSKELTKIISIAPLLNQNQIGITGHLYSVAFGSVDNTMRFENQRDRMASSIPEIYAVPTVGDKVVLNISDALICQYQGEQQVFLHYAVAINQLWFSRDPVALDVLGFDEIDRARKSASGQGRTASHEVYDNAVLLQLGVDDPRRMDLRSIKVN